jgi:hypothetical protein
MSDALRLWLEQIGLAQHAETFIANDIDLDVSVCGKPLAIHGRLGNTGSVRSTNPTSSASRRSPR